MSDTPRKPQVSNPYPSLTLAGGHVTCEYDSRRSEGAFLIVQYRAAPKRQGHGTQGLRELRELRHLPNWPDVEIQSIVAVNCDADSIEWWVKMGHKGLIDYAFDFDGRQIWPPPK